MHLNNPQLEAVTSSAAHLLVLAGAGSGKTRVLVERLRWLLEQAGLSATQVMAVTFTNKAASEMRHRLQEVCPRDLSHLWVGTFHGLAHRMLRAHATAAGLPETFQIMDNEDQLRILKRLAQELDPQFDSEQLSRVQQFINRQKDEIRRADRAQVEARRDQWLVVHYQRYEQYCRRMGLVDFGELLLRVYELWHEQPDLLAYYRKTFAHVLVDEFQDTNALQYQWLLTLIGQTGHLTVVGDDDQSIYSWRGARIENMHRLSQDFLDTRVIRLEQNYRSSQTILEAANALIAQNQGRLGKNLWTEQKDDQKIQLYGAFSDLDEARFVVQAIQQRLRAGRAPKSMAVLYRSNAQSRVLEQALLQAEVPFRIYGGVRFFERSEVRDVLAYCRLVYYTGDDAAFDRVVNNPPRGVGERSIEKIRELARLEGLSLWEAAECWVGQQGAARAAKGVAQFLTLITELRVLSATVPLPVLIEQLLERSGLLVYLRQRPDERTQAKIENSLELVTAAREFMEGSGVEEPGIVLSHFLSEVVLNSGGETETEDNVVKLMTVHAAKGLEFPIVFLVGLEEGLFPNRRALDVEARLEEERRLLYVGMTRAMQQLIFSYAMQRGYMGRAQPSRFLSEIPKALVDVIRMDNLGMETMLRAAGPSRMRQALSGAPPGTFSKGQKVMHARFGLGRVVAQEGVGAKERVEVQFEAVGRKWLMVTYAQLEPVL